MGCDGGSIPRRQEMVKTVKKKGIVDMTQQHVADWTICALSKNPLKTPIVSCALGKLYNKEAILELVLNKRSIQKAKNHVDGSKEKLTEVEDTLYGDSDVICPHIKTLKDVQELKLTPNHYTKTSSVLVGNTLEKAISSQFICPLTMKEMNGNTRFSYLATCGCVFSEPALKQVTSTVCTICSKPFLLNDIIPINSHQDKDKQFLNDRLTKILLDRKQQQINTKKSKVDKVEKKRKLTPDASDDALDKLKYEQPKHIKVSLPDLSHLEKYKELKSDAIDSLYTKKVSKMKNNLFSGTFTRYA